MSSHYGINVEARRALEAAQHRLELAQRQASGERTAAERRLAESRLAFAQAEVELQAARIRYAEALVEPGPEAGPAAGRRAIIAVAKTEMEARLELFEKAKAHLDRCLKPQDAEPPAPGRSRAGPAS